MKSIFTFTFLLILTLSGLSQYTPSPDSSAWPTSPDSGLVIGYGDYPLIVSDEDGGAIVAFQADNPQRIKVKRVDRYGWLQWNGWSGVIAGGVEDYQILTDVAEDGAGGILVAFLDVDEINLYEFYGYATVQRIDHNGNKLWGEGVRVAVVDSVIQSSPQIASDGQGGCIVNFLDNRFSPWPYFDFDAFVQRIDSMENLCWGDSAMRLTTSPGIQYNPMMLVNENSETFLRWSYMQKLDINGNKLWGSGGIPIGQLPGKVSMSDGQGGFFVSGILYINNVYRISCNHVDSSGQKLWGNEGITLVDSVLFAHHESDATGILYDDSDNIIISYFFAHSGEKPNTYLQKLTPNGIKLFGNEGMPVSNYLSNKRGSIFPSQDSIFAFWYDLDRQAYYIQKLDYNGNILWNQDTLFSTDGGGPLTYDGNGGLIMVYEKIDFSINLKKISKNGIIGGVITLIEDQSPEYLSSGFKLHQNYPNPFNATTTILFWLDKTSDIELKIYDINGRILQKINMGRKVSGEHKISLEMSAYASGLYLYQLTAGKHSQVKKFLLIK